MNGTAKERTCKFCGLRNEGDEPRCTGCHRPLDRFPYIPFTCPACGEEIAAEEGRCPECGTPFPETPAVLMMSTYDVPVLLFPATNGGTYGNLCLCYQAPFSHGTVDLYGTTKSMRVPTPEETGNFLAGIRRDGFLLPIRLITVAEAFRQFPHNPDNRAYDSEPHPHLPATL